MLRAGSEGAWLTGLVLADENPIYEDANANGIDDRFEVARKGTLLAATATKAARQALVQQWREAQCAKSPPAFFVQRPRPADLTASAPPE